jgi:hypothetical protein
MRARLATAVTAAVLTLPLLAVTAGASPSSAPSPEHKCRAATAPVEHKCDRPRN